MSDDSRKFAWYSAKHAKWTDQRPGAQDPIYRLKDGTTRRVTCISSSDTDSGTKWDDIVLLGEVDALVQAGRPSDNERRMREIHRRRFN